LNLRFLFSEIWAGLRSNVAMVVSIVLVTFVSLSFVGISALLQLQVSEMKNYWYDRAQVAIYLCTNYSDELVCPLGAVSDDQKNAIERTLESNVVADRIQASYFESHEEAYQKFLEEFADSSVASLITADQLNEAYWVNLIDPEESDLITETFTGQDGVEEVRDQRGYLDQIFALLNAGSVAAAGIAAIMLLSATLLIATTIRLSALSRRRELGIMKLVGASNFSIQMPFVLEGALAGLAGSLLSVVALVAVVQVVVIDFLTARLPFTSFVGLGDAALVAPYLILGGVILAALASAISIRRHLRI